MVQREILDLLYKQQMRCASYVRIEFLIKNLNKIKNNDLWFHVEYLDKKGYATIRQIYDGFITTEELKITAKGISLVENPEALNSELPI